VLWYDRECESMLKNACVKVNRRGVKKVITPEGETLTGMQVRQ
jgi:hypothetical protein